MEIAYNFYREAQDKARISSKGFDTRGGLNIIMIGFDYIELDQPYRLLHQIEKVLDIKLSLLDYWDDKVYDQFINIPQYLQFLEQLAKKLINQPMYYQSIEYGYISNSFLKTEFLIRIQLLVNVLKHYQKEGAKFLKMETL